MTYLNTPKDDFTTLKSYSKIMVHIYSKKLKLKIKSVLITMFSINIAYDIHGTKLF